MFPQHSFTNRLRDHPGYLHPLLLVSIISNSIHSNSPYQKKEQAVSCWDSSRHLATYRKYMSSIRLIVQESEWIRPVIPISWSMSLMWYFSITVPEKSSGWLMRNIFFLNHLQKLWFSYQIFYGKQWVTSHLCKLKAK